VPRQTIAASLAKTCGWRRTAPLLLAHAVTSGPLCGFVRLTRIADL